MVGFGTNRVVGKQLNKSGLSVNQMKGMSTLHGICGVKKIDNKEEIENTIIDKLSLLKKNENGHKNRLMADFNEEPKKKIANNENIDKKLVTENQAKIENEVPVKLIEEEAIIKVKKPGLSLKNLI